MSKSKVSGSDFRDELSMSLRMLRAWRHCFDNVGASQYKCPRCDQALGKGAGPKRPADLTGSYKGLGVLLEAKETGQPRADFARVEIHQQAALLAHEGLALVVFRWNCKPRHRAFAFPIDRWMLLQGELGRASVPLRDGERPASVIELVRQPVRDFATLGQGIPNNPVWDLRPAFEAMAPGVLGRLHEVHPAWFSTLPA